MSKPVKLESPRQSRGPSPDESESFHARILAGRYCGAMQLILDHLDNIVRPVAIVSCISPRDTEAIF